jgi:hypothetical protein
MRFNKNIHNLKPIMTKGLLKSRETKKNLYMATLTDKSPPALQRYRDYKNLYFKTLRAMKATNLFSVLFADDTTCLAKGFILRELIAYINAELRKIANWFRSNKMALNTGKTKYMIFRTRGKPINENDCQLVYNSTENGLPSDPEFVSPIERCTY